MADALLDSTVRIPPDLGQALGNIGERPLVVTVTGWIIGSIKQRIYLGFEMFFCFLISF